MALVVLLIVRNSLISDKTGIKLILDKQHNMNDHGIMKRKFIQGWPTIPPISTK